MYINNMVKIIKYALLIYFFTFSQAQADRLVPLKDWIFKNENYLKDKVTQSYLINRCSAAYLLVAGLTQTNSDGILSKQFADISQDLMIVNANILMSLKGWGQKDALQNIQDNVKRMGDAYYADAKDNYAKTGEYTSVGYIRDDLILCKKNYRNISKAI